MTGSSSTAGFDAYNATVFCHSDQLLEDLAVLADSAGRWAAWADGGKAPYYAHNQALLDAKGHRLLSLRWGGSNPHPFIECKSDFAQIVAEYLRSSYDHRPSRIDHAVDRRKAGLFDDMADYTKVVARKHGLKWEPAGDWVTPDAGRTIYLGSRKSQVFIRIYEKGLKYAHDMGLPVTDELREWVRFELEFKPQNKAAKALSSKVDGPRLWGSTIWTAELAAGVLSMQTEAISIRERRESNSERALRFMCAQYSSHLRVLLEQCDFDLAQFGHAIADRANLLPDEVDLVA